MRISIQQIVLQFRYKVKKNLSLPKFALYLLS